MEIFFKIQNKFNDFLNILLKLKIHALNTLAHLLLTF